MRSRASGILAPRMHFPAYVRCLPDPGEYQDRGGISHECHRSTTMRMVSTARMSQVRSKPITGRLGLS